MKNKIGKRRAILLPGCKYINGNGVEYECVRRQNDEYIMRSRNGWTYRVKHVWLYDDNHIEWDVSSAGWREDGVR